MALGAGVAALVTPMVARIARMLGAIDQPSARKVNRRPNMPLLGGVAVAVGFFVAVAFSVVVAGDTLIFKGHVEAYLLGGVLLLGVGAWDDRFGLKPGIKLAMQLGAAAIAIAFGFQLDHLTDPFSLNVFEFPGWLAWLATTVWIVGVTNAINLIDGLDGLATGVSLIIGATLTFIAWQSGGTMAAMVGAAYIGALLGFLPFNFSPARIFLGDTGALFIGYVLSLISLEAYQKVTVLTFIVPILALAVPIIDTGLSVLRRMRRGQPIFSPDRLHIHHRLLQSEGSQRSAVLSIYFLTACFCVIAVSFTRLEGYAAILFLIAVVLLTLRLLRNLGFFEIEEAADPVEAPHEGGVR
jgi:UDP-GlcNAc:undecaprenyl-phosphate GlcNAc-1-phosphate transferase